MAEVEVKDNLEWLEPLDEIELAKYSKMATDALTGHFPQHIYGDQSHIEVLAKALERCVDAIQLNNAGEVIDTATGKIEDLEVELDEVKGKINRIKEIVLGLPQVST